MEMFAIYSAPRTGSTRSNGPDMLPPQGRGVSLASWPVDTPLFFSRDLAFPSPGVERNELHYRAVPEM